MFNFFNTKNPNAIECLNGWKCTIDPRTIALNETFIYEIRQLTYYILKIKELGYENISLVNTIIETLASINFGFTYQQKELEKILSNLCEKRTEVIDFYKSLCKKKNIDCQLLQSMQPNNDDMNFIKAIMSGEKQSIKKNTQISSCKKNLYEIIITITKTTASTITKLANFNIFCTNERYNVLELINALNFLNFREEKLARKIIQFAQISHNLNNTLNNIYQENYGEKEKQIVSFDQIQGPCILISGDDFCDLDTILQATKDTNINIYTHDRMIFAFQYPYFKKFTQLKGHYQNKETNFNQDFSEFPGPILLTKNYMNKIDNIYRGNLFSIDFIAGKTITKIKNNDFSILIKKAEEMQGFANHTPKNYIQIGYNLNTIYSELDPFIEKINNGNLKNIYIIGLLNYGYHSDIFFEKLYEKIGNKNLIISLAYEKKGENIFHIKSFYDFSLVYKIIQYIKAKIDTEKTTIKTILTQCTNDSLINLFIMKHLGIKEIYITCCNVNTLNPSIIECLQKQFAVKQIKDLPNTEIEL